VSHVSLEPQRRLAANAGEPDTRSLRGPVLMFARIGWLAVTVLSVIYVMLSFPTVFSRLQTVCAAELCPPEQLTVKNIQELAQLGFSVSFFATYAITLELVFAFTSIAVGAFVFWRKGNDRMALLVACVLAAFGAAAFMHTLDTITAASPILWWIFGFVLFLGNVVTVFLFFLLPDGRFVPRWTRWTAGVLLFLGLVYHFFPDTPLSQWLAEGPGMVLSVSIIVIATGSQLYRYRRVSTPVQRQQTKWIVWGVVVGMGGLQGAQLALPLLNQPHVFIVMFAYALMYGSALLIPVSIGIALLRYRLWDVDPLINRTLVYGMLTASVVGVYVLIVGTLGLVLQARGSFLVSLVATGLVATLFQPLRERVQRGVNHLVYGERDEPYAALVRLGQRLETTLAPDAVLPAIVQTVRETLKVPYVAIAIDHEGICATAASVGKPLGEPLILPLLHHGEPIGQLILSPRAPGETWNGADRRLLNDLARQVGIAAHTVRLTTDLQRSRERLVLTREEERRRLRNDLHDGLAPTLATLALAASNVVDLLPDDPVAAKTLAAELEHNIRNTVGDIRRIVYGLRPPALDELGLVATIRECASQYSRQPRDQTQPATRLDVRVVVPDHLPPLPAAIEVAAYRITQEALNNVARHAQARTCTVRLELADALLVEIVDDGVGVPLERRAGIGLRSMQERAAELGGSCIIEAVGEAGTRVRAILPVARV